MTRDEIERRFNEFSGEFIDFAVAIHDAAKEEDAILIQEIPGVFSGKEIQERLEMVEAIRASKVNTERECPQCGSTGHYNDE